jgi:hypothetical protein
VVFDQPLPFGLDHGFVAGVRPESNHLRHCLPSKSKKEPPGLTGLAPFLSRPKWAVGAKF